MRRATITYAHHNCFCLDLDGRVLLFDYPDVSHRPASVETVVGDALAGADATIFLSHSHPDHCTPEVVDLAKTARRAQYVLSYDVPELVPELDIEEAVVVDPDEGPVRAGDLVVSGLEATDLGVAFLIEAPGLRIYYGGDLAEWAWPTLDERTRQAEVQTFERTLEQIAAWRPDIAFQNADPRMPDTRGGVLKFVDRVRPPLLVPMHLFGETVTLADLEDRISSPGTKVFRYREPGDTLVVPVG